MAAIEIIGDREAAARLVAMGRRAEALEPVMDQEAERTARSVTGVPVDTGRLAASIEVLGANDRGYAVGSRLPYARYVFRGTRYVDAHPARVPTDTGRRGAAAIARYLERA